MKITFALDWNNAKKNVARAFKSRDAFSLFNEYISRIAKFFLCNAQGFHPNPKAIVWVCEREKGSRVLSSEQIAKELSNVLNSGASELQVVIGGADGFSRERLSDMSPNLRWSFGSLTLSHELAAVVAAEQIYRALTIIRNLPYHSGH